MFVLVVTSCYVLCLILIYICTKKGYRIIMSKVEVEVSGYIYSSSVTCNFVILFE